MENIKPVKDKTRKRPITIWESQLEKLKPLVEAPPYRGNLSRFIQELIDEKLQQETTRRAS
jgi:hypothetical protein